MDIPNYVVCETPQHIRQLNFDPWKPVTTKNQGA